MTLVLPIFEFVCVLFTRLGSIEIAIARFGLDTASIPASSFIDSMLTQVVYKMK